MKRGFSLHFVHVDRRCPKVGERVIYMNQLLGMQIKTVSHVTQKPGGKRRIIVDKGNGFMLSDFYAVVPPAKEDRLASCEVAYPSDNTNEKICS